MKLMSRIAANSIASGWPYEKLGDSLVLELSLTHGSASVDLGIALFLVVIPIPLPRFSRCRNAQL
jgi:hypothetical protein